jgi:hypothetical protein
MFIISATLGAIIIGFVVSLYLPGAIIVLGSLAAIVLLMWFVQNPHWSIYALCFSLSFEGFVVKTPIIGVSLPNAILLTSVAALALRSVSGKKLRKPSKGTRFYFVLAGLTVLPYTLRLVLAPTFETLDVVPTHVGFFLSFALVPILIRDKKQVRYSFRWLMLGVVLIVLVALLDSIGIIHTAPWQGEARSVGGLKSPFSRSTGSRMAAGLQGMLFVSVLTVCILSVMECQNLVIRPMVAALVVLWLLLGVMVNQSRTVWLATLAAASSAIAFFTLRKFGKSLLALAPFISVLTLICICALWPVLHSKIAYIADSFVHIGGQGGVKTFQHRINQMRFALSLVKSNPWLLLTGVGPGEFEKLFAVVNPLPGFALRLHNLYLGRLMEAGFVTPMSLMGLLLVAFRKAWQVGLRSSDRELQLLGFALASSLVGMFVQGFGFGGGSVKILWLTIGFSATVWQTSDTSNTV